MKRDILSCMMCKEAITFENKQISSYNTFSLYYLRKILYLQNEIMSLRI